MAQPADIADFSAPAVEAVGEARARMGDESQMRRPRSLSGIPPGLVGITAAHNFPGSIWAPFGGPPMCGSSVEKTEPGKIRIELPAETEEDCCDLTEGDSLWTLLDGWARFHGTDPDLALLVCACSAAHAARQWVLLPSHDGRRLPAPTLIGRSKDVGFLLAVSAASAPFLSIQRELIARYEATRRESYRNLRQKRSLCGAERMYRSFVSTADPYLDPSLEPEVTVRFIVEGNLPKMSRQVLQNCHRYNAMVVGEIEELPRTLRRKEDRIRELERVIRGYAGSQYALRGFIRFTEEDLTWILTEQISFTLATLPVCSDRTGLELSRKDLAGAKDQFATMHRKVARHVLRFRFDDSECEAGFSDDKVAECHRQLREAYNRVSGAVSHKAKQSDVLYDVIVWYLLQLTTASGIRIEPMEIATRSYDAACRLRRRIAEMIDQYDEVQLGLIKRAQVLRIVERMERLVYPSSARDIARGFNKQHMSEIGPLVDFLVEHQVLVRDKRKLKLAEDARSVFDQIPAKSFMPAYRDVPDSLTARLQCAEQMESMKRASETASPISNSS